MKSFIKLSVIVILTATTMTACYTSRVVVGDKMDINAPRVKVNTVKNHIFLDGLVPAKNGEKASEYVGKRENYVIENQRTFGDGFLGVITLGIYTPTTTNYYVPLD